MINISLSFYYIANIYVCMYIIMCVYIYVCLFVCVCVCVCVCCVQFELLYSYIYFELLSTSVQFELLNSYIYFEILSIYSGLSSCLSIYLHPSMLIY